VPYTGVHYVSIPEFQGLGTIVGQNVSAALAGQMTGAQALEASQRAAEREMKRAGYGQ
jgi:ABC-type glycerol-3-phosphate transport system substrate-binding protein